MTPKTSYQWRENNATFLYERVEQFPYWTFVKATDPVPLEVTGELNFCRVPFPPYCVCWAFQTKEARDSFLEVYGLEPLTLSPGAMPKPVNGERI